MSAPNTPSRRQLFKIAATGFVALSLSDALHAEESENNETLELSFEKHRELSKIGGSEVVKSARGKLVVARIDETNFVALSALCTHRKCTVEYVHRQKQFICPCHGARFDLEGNVQRGPARQPLARYTTQSTPETVVVRLDTPDEK